MTAGRAIAWIVIAILALTIVAAVAYMLIPKPAEPLSIVASLLG